jgi:hypothetical protein
MEGTRSRSRHRVVEPEGVTGAFFGAALARHVEAYIRHFADRLISVSVWGSAHRGEAIPGVSDLDLQAFITDAPVPADDAWFQRERHILEGEFPGTLGLSRPFPVSNLLNGLQPEATPQQRRLTQALGFRLRHDGTLLWGTDPVPEQSALPTLDRSFGIGGFESQRDLARWAAGLNSENKTDFPLPDSPPLRLRKLARLAVLAGGWYLIAEGRLLSLRGSDVLPALHDELPEWDAFLRRTEPLYILPTEENAAIAQIEPYTREVARWADDLSERLGIG